MELCHRLIACRPHWQGAQFSPFFVRFIPPRACATIFHFLSARDTNYNWSPTTNLLISSLRTFYTYFAPPQHLGTQREENMPSTSNDVSIPSSNPPHSAAPPAFVTPSTPIAAPIILPLLPSLVYQPSFHPSGQVTSSFGSHCARPSSMLAASQARRHGSATSQGLFPQRSLRKFET